MPLLIKLLLLLLVAPLVYMLLPFLLEPDRKLRFCLFVTAHALLLTFAVLFVLNLPATILSDEVTFLNSQKYVSNKKRQEAYKFINNNFLLIDNTYDKQLIPKPDQSQGDSTFIAITNRQKLLTLFNLLANDSNNLDLVICDIGFGDITAYDSLLSKSMLTLYQQNKLLVSVAGEASSNTLFKFPTAASGDVKEETNEKLFTTHRLKRKDFYSLPYQVYACVNRVKETSSFFFNSLLKETYSDGKIKWKMNTFLPQFFITDESLLNTEFVDVKDNGLSTNHTDSTGTGSVLLSTLGNATSESGQEDLILNIDQRKRNNKKNIILIGTFNGGEDLHKTAFADLHGPVILLNLIYALQSKQNNISVLSIILCLVFFFIISLFMFRRIYRRVCEYRKLLKDETIQSIEKRKESNVVSKFFLLLIEFIFKEEAHYFLLLLAVILIYYSSGIMINGISLAVYLIAFETFAVYFGKFSTHLHYSNKNTGS